MPTYYTFRDQVPLLPGETLGFTSGRGYYAAGTPTPTQTTKNTSSYNEGSAGLPSSIVAAPAPTAKPAAVQPTPATNAAQVAANTTSYEEEAAVPSSSVGQSAATLTRTQPVAANTAQIVKNTVGYAGEALSSGSSGITYYTNRDLVQLGPEQTLGFTPGRGYYAIGPAGRRPGAEPSPTQPTPAHAASPQLPTASLLRLQPSATGTRIPHASELQNLAPLRQLLRIQPTATGTPIPSRRQLSAITVAAQSVAITPLRMPLEARPGRKSLNGSPQQPPKQVTDWIADVLPILDRYSGDVALVAGAAALLTPFAPFELILASVALAAATVNVLASTAIVVENPTPDNIAAAVWNDLLVALGVGASVASPKAARSLVNVVTFTIGYVEGASDPTVDAALPKPPLIVRTNVIEIPRSVYDKGWPAILEWEERQL